MGDNVMKDIMSLMKTGLKPGRKNWFSKIDITLKLVKNYEPAEIVEGLDRLKSLGFVLEQDNSDVYKLDPEYKRKAKSIIRGKATA